MTKEMTEKNMNSSSDDSNRVYVPLRRLQLALNRIIEIAIPFHLKNLEQHKHNIQTYKEKEEWNQLFKEQIKATQTIQQLKADLREIENLREQVMASDEHILMEKIIPIKSKVCLTVQEFIELHKDLSNPLFHLNSYNDQNISCDKSDENCDEINTNLQIRTQIHEQKSSLISWEHLKKELSDLNAMLNTLATTVMGQRERVDRIEDNISTTHEDVLIGTTHLSKAAALKSAFIPVTAALVGGAVFGPIGMMAGFKFSGVVSAVGASIIGYSGVKLIQKKAISNDETELNLLKQDINKENSNAEIHS